GSRTRSRKHRRYTRYTRGHGCSDQMQRQDGVAKDDTTLLQPWLQVEPTPQGRARIGPRRTGSEPRAGAREGPDRTTADDRRGATTRRPEAARTLSRTSDETFQLLHRPADLCGGPVC